MATKRYWETKLTKALKLPFKIGFVKAIEVYNITLEKYRTVEKEYYEIRKECRINQEGILKRKS